MNECYKKELLGNSAIAALACLIPVINWICIIVYLNKLWT